MVERVDAAVYDGTAGRKGRLDARSVWFMLAISGHIGDDGEGFGIDVDRWAQYALNEINAETSGGRGYEYRSSLRLM